MMGRWANPRKLLAWTLAAMASYPRIRLTSFCEERSPASPYQLPLMPFSHAALQLLEASLELCIDSRPVMSA
jgi:hypothetical protein